ncbi:uncharacterized protein CLUP02_03583 [Colletotrichum lupini]|uniref:Uncharacterized protein n=1 Tax=Colletotrichum lupini TaxID=145971 RepID=A0A9Q8SIQ7_9PEZI|nr:uncharacterized protein CLUP02_03583 [Colletotrichum lupini]KAK1721647.1 hypothetical protein BDP67DRAFT_498055 [Colletotrichum lupini]UQC78109.1 hypothetical protein CLUP02_03583 [Colletotrichum lupini]
MSNGNSSDNVFVRFKQKVDDHVASAFQRFLGIPSAVSRLNSSWPEPPLPSREKELEDTRPLTDNNTNLQPRVSSTQHPHPTVFDLFGPMSSISALFKAEEVTESLYQLMCFSFIIDSPYSPLRLHDMPQPVPRDLPNGEDPTLFGFEDAFEDLLMVSSGQDLPDIYGRVRFKKEVRDSFPHGLPPMLWLHQLTRQGLWDGWEPRPEVLDRAVSERWQRWLQEQNDPFKDQRTQSSRNDSAPEERRRSVTEENPAQESSVRPPQDHGETEEDSYFSVMGSARLNTSRETSTSTAPTPRNYSSTKDLSPQGLPQGWRVVEKVQEREDGKGNVHITKTITTYNESGEEVGKQTERQSNYTWSASFSTGGYKNRGRDQREDDDIEDKGSWFWK